LEVEEGVVRFTRLNDGRSIDVRAGYYAMVRKGEELVARAMAMEGERGVVAEKKRGYEEGEILFEEDFEDIEIGFLPSYFKIEGRGSWAVRKFNGNQVLSGEGIKTSILFGNSEWRDYKVQVRILFNIVQSSSKVAIIIRHDTDSGKNYQLELFPNRVSLRKSIDKERDASDFITKKMEINPRIWHTLRCVCKGNIIEFWIDGKLAIRSQEDNVSKGQCKLYIRDSNVFFDDIIVKSID